MTFFEKQTVGRITHSTLVATDTSLVSSNSDSSRYKNYRHVG